MVEEAEAATEQASAPEAERTKRERSLIEFPYADLQSAADMAAMVMQRAAGNCEEKQLAAWLNQSVSGGTFRSRLSAAKLFGLLEGSNKKLTLTDLGRRIADGQSGADAKVEAFLRVALYANLYEKLNGYSLPPPAAIERQMVNMGVVSTQADRARQVFNKSLVQAGFIDTQNGRFVKPASSGYAPEKPREQVDDRINGGNGGDDEPPLHPFILGLLKALPEPGKEWPIAERAKWLQTASSIFGLIYKGDGSVTIEASAP